MMPKILGNLLLIVTIVSTMVTITPVSVNAAETSVTALAKKTHFHGIAMDSSDTSRLYLATHHGLFAIDADGGADRISENRNDYMGFTPHPTNPTVLYGSGHPTDGGNMGFITSKDGGKTWEKLSDGVDGPVDFHQMDVSKADPNVVIGNSRGLQVSKDGGQSWRKIGPAPDGLIDLAASAKDSDTFYAATQSGIVKSTDGGKSWSDAYFLRRPSTMIHVTSDGSIFAYQIGTGLVRASESDLNWNLVSESVGGAYVLHLSVNPDNDKLLYAITTNPQTRVQAIFTSENGGETWRQLGDN